MSNNQLAAALVAAAILSPIAAALASPQGNPIMNGDFDMDTSQPAADPIRPYVNQCFGVGHQALDPLYSAWGDWAIATINDPTNATPEDAAAANTYWQVVAEDYAADPAGVYGCRGVDVALVNPSEKLVDPGFMWSNDPGTTFGDFDGDGDREARIPRVPVEHNHNLWQSVATTTQAFSADFDLFAFRVESGVIPAGANIQIGLALSPGYAQHPFVGVFWEGAILFRSNDFITPGVQYALDPVARGEIICPGGYTPCLLFKAEYDAADNAGKRTLLGQARIVQTSFWAFSGGVGDVIVDDVVYYGAAPAGTTPPNVPAP